MSSDAHSINGIGTPVICRMKGVPPKSQKVTELVLCRIIYSQVGVNVVGLLYRETFFCR